VRVGSPLAGMLPDSMPAEAEPALCEIVAGQDTALSTDPADVTLEQLAGLLTMPAPPSVFDGLSEDERTRLLERSYLVSFKPGDVLTRTGHDAKALFVIVDGVVEIHRDGRTVGFGAPGDLVGEMAFLLDQPRTADVHVRAPGRALILSERTVGQLIASEPVLAAKLLLNVSRLLARKILERVP
jgi:CRP-like cAMP-binding protein